MRLLNEFAVIWDHLGGSDVRNFVWTPDSRFVSYLHKETLYKITVPLDNAKK